MHACMQIKPTARQGFCLSMGQVSGGVCSESLLQDFKLVLLLLLSRFSRVQLCATPETAAHQAPPVPGILQARTLKWAAISFSSAWKWKVKVKSLSCVRLLATPWTAAYQAPLSMGFSKQEYWSGVPLPSPLNWYSLSEKPFDNNSKL